MEDRMVMGSEKRIQWLLCLLFLTRFGSASTVESSQIVQADLKESMNQKTEKPTIEMIFSDVDGTLVHYPESVEGLADSIIQLPASSTGMKGIISAGTLQKFDKLRSLGKKVVIVSGMRSSTLLKRIPYLPRADAYCSEAGGRIFYPTEPPKEGPTFKSHPYEGCNPDDFGIVEDMDWKAKMEVTAGSDGFVGDNLEAEVGVVPVAERKSLLWDYCRVLQEKGFVVDTKGYATCFRVNFSQQTEISKDEFEALKNAEVPEGLSTSVNLGNIDFYPSTSGKKNWSVQNQRLLTRRSC